jgi:heme/copper-type cytochrome/quinol oxidase subunit 3
VGETGANALKEVNMSQPADLLEELSDTEALLPPRVPSISGPPTSSRQGAAFDRDAARVRYEAERMGAFLFVTADGVLFAALMGAVVLVFLSHPEVFSYGHYFLNARFAVAATSVLFLSCLTASLAVRAVAVHDAPGLRNALALTVLLGGVFRAQHPASARYAARFRFPTALRVPATPVRKPVRVATVVPDSREVGPLVSAGALGSHAVYPTIPSEPRNAHAFFGLYLLATGLQALHVLLGVVAFAWLLWRARREPLFRDYGAIDRAALYWNATVLMRIVVVPLFYFAR